MWVAPVLEDGARSVHVDLPHGDWIDFWTGAEIAGGGEVDAPAPLDRIPVWVRRGALIVTYPAEHVRRGLGDTPGPSARSRRRCGASRRAAAPRARLADGTVVRRQAANGRSPPNAPLKV